MAKIVEHGVSQYLILLGAIIAGLIGTHLILGYVGTQFKVPAVTQTNKLF
jgi:hypothetical protein